MKLFHTKKRRQNGTRKVERLMIDLGRLGSSNFYTPLRGGGGVLFYTRYMDIVTVKKDGLNAHFSQLPKHMNWV
jgi:hypothetical protein